MHTIGEAARRLAAATGQKPEPIANALRHWVQREWLVPAAQQERGTKGTIRVALFDRSALARARIQLAASAVGLHSELGILRPDLKRALLPTGEQVETNPEIEAAIASVVSGGGDRWEIEVALKGGGGVKGTRWLRNGEPLPEFEFDPDRWPAIADGAEAFVKLPVSDLLRGLDLSE